MAFTVETGSGPLPFLSRMERESFVVLATTGGDRLFVLNAGWLLSSTKNSYQRRLVRDRDVSDEYRWTIDGYGGVTDELTIAGVDLRRNWYQDFIGYPSTVSAVDVETTVQNAGQVPGHQAVAIPQEHVTDDRLPERRYTLGVPFSSCATTVEGFRLEDDRIVTVDDNRLTECEHTGETERIAAAPSRSRFGVFSDREFTHRCKDCGCRY
jgi:hypothetical protein